LPASQIDYSANAPASASPYGQESATAGLQGVYDATVADRRKVGRAHITDLHFEPTNVFTSPGGGLIELRGHGLMDSTDVSLDGLGTTNWLVIDDGLARFTVPAHAPGGPYEAFVTFWDGSKIPIAEGCRWV
jgi:hypothetical protein